MQNKIVPYTNTDDEKLFALIEQGDKELSPKLMKDTINYCMYWLTVI